LGPLGLVIEGRRPTLGRPSNWRLVLYGSQTAWSYIPNYAVCITRVLVQKRANRALAASPKVSLLSDQVSRYLFTKTHTFSKMVMNSPPDWAAELDPGQPLERPLPASPASTAVRLELSVYRENESGRTLRVVEIISSDNGAQPSREIERFLDLRQDGILPLYTIASQPRVGWNIGVGYGKGSVEW
jgi:hypothetical protein